MKRAIYYHPQRVLSRKQDKQVIFSTSENQQLSLLNIPFSSEILSTPSLALRMRCCSMFC